MKEITLKFYAEHDGKKIMEECEINCRLEENGLSELGALVVQSVIASRIKKLAQQEFK